ncbi:MAG: hypothetical protein WA895_11175 [Streptosporangiaceae bacterium]
MSRQIRPARAARSLLLNALDADSGHEPDLQLRDALGPGTRFFWKSLKTGI